MLPPFPSHHPGLTSQRALREEMAKPTAEAEPTLTH